VGEAPSSLVSSNAASPIASPATTVSAQGQIPLQRTREA
jgi:hypothetical protein